MADGVKTAFIGAIAGVVGGVLSSAGSLLVAHYEGARQIEIHQEDTGVKMVEIAIGIVSAEPKPQNKPLRQWAVKVLTKYAPADVPLGEAAQALLFENALDLGRTQLRFSPLGSGPIGHGPIGGPAPESAPSAIVPPGSN
jgi:hypothetical protein